MEWNGLPNFPVMFFFKLSIVGVGGGGGYDIKKQTQKTKHY